MDRALFDRIYRQAKRIVAGLVATAAVLLLILTIIWRDRAPVDTVELDPAPDAESELSVTWFGVGTLLIDDGTTQILIDGFISRPTLMDVLLGRPVENDAATINYFLNEYRVRRLAAIIPVHSHFDHAMDVGAIANRSSASILGSESTANIARGVRVPEDQIVVVENNADYTFGNFTVRFIESVHAPVGWRGSVPFPGTIDEPLKMPAPVKAWREGGSYSVVISHPRNTLLVQGSAGIRVGALDDVEVDTVLLGVGLLGGLGDDYLRDYWNATVTATGASTVIPIHFDDYTKPFGTIAFPPSILDNVPELAARLRELRDTYDTETRIVLPGFAEPIPLVRPLAGDEAADADTTT
ncbi:MAG: MBL fold metallo-hydrolase [Woeseiaceae bacterium]|nr:MBL fold metallo-hydrolase [Woeseiaceae bacterium]